VAKARLERADGETLLIVGLLAEGFDGGTLHDEHDAAVILSDVDDVRSWNLFGT
jgi:hypothetical protein